MFVVCVRGVGKGCLISFCFMGIVIVVLEYVYICEVRVMEFINFVFIKYILYFMSVLLMEELVLKIG